MTTIEEMAAKMAVSATGYGAIINGFLDIQTITDTRKGCAINAILIASNRSFAAVCEDPACDCAERILGERFPGVRIVPVSVQVAQ